MIERRCLFRRTDFETVKVRIDSQPAGALRWNDKHGWIPDAECEQRLNLYLPEHAKMWNRHQAEDYIRAACTLIPKPTETPQCSR